MVNMGNLTSNLVEPKWGEGWGGQPASPLNPYRGVTGCLPGWGQGVDRPAGYATAGHGLLCRRPWPDPQRECREAPSAGGRVQLLLSAVEHCLPCEHPYEILLRLELEAALQWLLAPAGSSEWWQTV